MGTRNRAIRSLSLPVILVVLLSLLPLPVPSTFSDDCEVIDAFSYERRQEVIVTDWYAGYPYGRYETLIAQCADVTILNDAGISRFSTDIEIAVTFSNEDSAAKKFACERRRLEQGETFSCSVCFESSSPISDMSCTFR